MLATLLVAALTASSASAMAISPRASITEFTTSPVVFNFPPGREGFNASTASKAPCGNMTMGARANYPLTGGQISLSQTTAIDNLNIVYTNDKDPARFHAFSSFGAATVQDIGSGGYCTAGPDFAALGMAAGDVATLMVFYQLDGAETYYYHCADVQLVAESSFTKPSYTCANATDVQIAASNDTLSMSGWSSGMAPTATASSGSHASSSAAAAAASSSSTSTSRADRVVAGAGAVLAAVGAAMLF